MWWDRDRVLVLDPGLSLGVLRRRCSRAVGLDLSFGRRARRRSSCLDVGIGGLGGGARLC